MAIMAATNPKKAMHLPHATPDPWRVVSSYASHLRIAHQIAGRVRFKLAAAALDDPQVRALDGERLKDALATVSGVREISINLLARSCTVAYDNATIPDAAWPDLLAGHRTPAAAALLGLLAAAAASHRPTRRKENAS